MWVGCQRHAPGALPQGMTRYPIYRRLGGPQGRSGRVRKISPPPGFDPRTVQPVASRYTDCARGRFTLFGDVDPLRLSQIMPVPRASPLRRGADTIKTVVARTWTLLLGMCVCVCVLQCVANSVLLCAMSG
jgi:hypothetical protein